MAETDGRWLFSLTAVIFWFMIWMPACSGRTPHPLSAKASLLRFWRTELSGVPLPTFLLNKASPLNATSMAVFSALLEHNSLDHRISSFCSAADLLCSLRVASADLASSNGVYQNYFPTSGNKQYSTHSLRTRLYRYATHSLRTRLYRYATNATSPGVEVGRFFRESKLKTGTQMALPDLKDYMPQRSFLPRSLADKFPVTSAALPGLLKLFRIPSNSSMETVMRDTVYECERAPAQGETKRCVTSIEGMVEFAKQILGRHVQVMTTASTHGSQRNVTVGTVSGLAGGGVTDSVSCHESMFPFLMYSCHSLPKVRVYEADLLGSDEKDNNKDKVKVQKKINHGVGICHLDTTVWSPNYAAFRALDGKPGGIEVCHWISQNDLIWVPTSSS